MTHSTVRGRIQYTHDRYGVNGREWFTITVAPDRSQTIRAMCEMDDIGLLRDVTYSVGPSFQARDCSSRLSMRDSFQGSSWFWFHDNEVECEGLMANGGRFSQRVTLSQPTPVFACHPLYCDGWHAAAYDHGSAEKSQLLRDCTNSSMPLDGSAAPSVGVVEKKLEYVGREEVEVPAGRFIADRYRIHPMRRENPEWTPLDFWVRPPEVLFVKLRWDMIEMTYELAELEGDFGILGVETAKSQRNR